MNISHFFIDRPIFAGVTSIVITLVGALAVFTLPIAQYPNIVPPVVAVNATYPGASAQTVADTVASPIEEQVNGVEGMIYMMSQSASSGSMGLNVTFEIGTDIDMAQVLTQNRVSLAQASLPSEVMQTGISVQKQSPSLLLVVNMISPGGEFDDLFLSNYVSLQVYNELARVPGVGSLTIFGERDYAIWAWLDPSKLVARNLSASDVTRAISEQNVQIAAGSLGNPPMVEEQINLLTINAEGRLVTPEEFGNIIVKTSSDGQVVRVSDVARVELGAQNYSMNSYLDNAKSVGIGLFQLPGANAIETAELIRAKMEDLKTRFPPGIDYQIPYDTTAFIEESIHSVAETFRDAVLLVILVVMVFLQNWRSALIPVIAVPVSIVGTFAVMKMIGFSLNNISLFGLVLAIGIVVDDAIVVVENIERNMADGMKPRDAARKAMDEVSGPVVATALVLVSVFLPTAFISGITGEFFRQFAVTISVSTVISAFNSLTLSPALGTLLLKPHHAKPDLFTRGINKVFGWFFSLFNKGFDGASKQYAKGVRSLVRISGVALLVYVGLLVLTFLGFRAVPIGFVPNQDQGYLIVNVQLPDAASLERTDAVSKTVTDILLKVPGVEHVVGLVGYSMVASTSITNTASLIVTLDSFEERDKDHLGARVIALEIMKAVAGILDAQIGVFGPPAVQGLGSTGGVKMMIEDRGSLGSQVLANSTEQFIAAGVKDPNFSLMFSSFRANVPQVFVDIDREKAKMLNVDLSNLFSTLQIYLGSKYINNFTYLGQNFNVQAQADAPYRRFQNQIGELQVGNTKGDMVPLGTVVKVRDITGPSRIIRYNLYESADMNINVPVGVSTGQAITAADALAKQVLPSSMVTQWTDIAYQQVTAGNTMIFIFPLCVLFVFLVLAAQYESWSLPLAIVLIVPMCLLCAIGGVWLLNMENNIFTQIGLVVLVGLACKNAILIVEFAKVNQDKGMSREDAVVEACHTRLRPILMTSFAFTMGVVPLVLATGAGMEMRVALGVAVFFGMLGVTFFGIFLTPVFYNVIMKYLGGKPKVAAAPEHEEPAKGL